MPASITALVGVLASALGGGAIAVAAASVLVYGAFSIGFSFASTYISSLFTKKPSPKPSEMKTVIKQAAAARRRSYGLTMVGGVMVMLEENYKMLCMVIATGQGPINRVIAHYLDDRQVAVDGNGVVVSWPYRYLSYITTSLGGENPAAHGHVANVCPWAWTYTEHLGKGVNSVGIVLGREKEKRFMEMFPNGARVEYKQLREGALVYDPRTGKTAYSDNAALCIRDFLISEYGMRLPKSVVSVADGDWAKAADICDEAVPLKAGGTEPRYRIAMTYQLDEAPSAVLRRMLNAADAEIFPTPEGGLTIQVGKWRAPTVTLDEDAITGISGLCRGADVLSRYNIIRAQYTSPDHKFEEVDADPWADEESVSLYGESAQDVQFYESPSHGQTRRLMKRAFAALNASWRMTITTNLRGLSAFGERFIRVKIAEFNINTTFEIQGQPRCILGDNGAVIGVEVELIALSASAFSWNPAREEGTAPGANSNTPPLFELPVPTGFSVTQNERISGGTMLIWAKLKADIPVGGEYIRYQVSSDNENTWTDILGDEDTAEAEFGPLTDGVFYLFRAQTITPAATAESMPTAIVALESINTPELVKNGTFIYDGDWKKGEGWSIVSGRALKAKGLASTITQATAAIIAGRKYRVSFTLSNYVAGTVKAGLFGGIAVYGESRMQPGNYTEIISAPANVTTFGLSASEDADLSITNLSIKEII